MKRGNCCKVCGELIRRIKSEVYSEAMRSEADGFPYLIKIGQGLGKIDFGASSAELERCLGTPDESEILDPPTGSTFLWYYTRLELQIIFQQPDCGMASGPHGIVQFVSTHPQLELGGRKVMGQAVSEALALFQEYGCLDFTEEIVESVDSITYRAFRSDTKRVSLEFRSGMLDLVLWGKPWR